MPTVTVGFLFQITIMQMSSRAPGCGRLTNIYCSSSFLASKFTIWIYFLRSLLKVKGDLEIMEWMYSILCECPAHASILGGFSCPLTVNAELP